MRLLLIFISSWIVLMGCSEKAMGQNDSTGWALWSVTKQNPSSWTVRVSLPSASSKRSLPPCPGQPSSGQKISICMRSSKAGCSVLSMMSSFLRMKNKAALMSDRLRGLDTTISGPTGGGLKRYAAFMTRNRPRVNKQGADPLPRSGDTQN